MKSVARFAYVATTLALVSSLAWADGAPVHASMSLTNLNYSVVGLDGGGAAVPSLTPSSSSVFSVYAVPNIGDYANAVSSGDLPGDQFDSASASVSLPGGLGTATKQGNTQFTDASLTANELLNDVSRSVYTQVKTYADFTLSAHSKLVITGDLVLSTQIDAAAVSALWSNSTGALTLFADARFAPFIVTSPGTSLSTNASSSYEGALSTYQYWGWAASAKQVFTATGAGDVLAVNELPGGHFEMQITNAGDTDIAFQLNSKAYTHATLSAVPEPQTWGLMALGLVCVAGTAFKRRRA